MTDVAQNLYGAQPARSQDPNELFVINLCASMTPMPEVPKQLKGLERYKLYQISKVEDGRRRYRLRLGFFATEDDAELLIPSLRSMYPAALVTCANTDDLKFLLDGAIAGKASPGANAAIPSPSPAIAAKPAAPTAPNIATPTPVNASPNKAAPVTNRPATTATLAAPAAQSGVGTNTVARKPAQAAPSSPTTSPTVAPSKPLPTNATANQTQHSTSPAAKPAVAAAKTVAAKPTPAVIPVKANDIKLELIDPPATKTVSEAASLSDTQIFHVGRGIQIPDSGLQLSADDTQIKSSASSNAHAPKPAAAATPSPAPASKPAAHASKPAGAATASVKAKDPIVSATLAAVAKPSSDYIPILDTTLTIRTLTKAEADDPNRAKWFVVQLASSELPIDISTMPKLDIFAAYQLYSVALMEEGSIHHTLRLGFFKERVSADAVMGYLKTFFSTPSVVQISGAEHDRFSGATHAETGKKITPDATPKASPAKPSQPNAARPATIAAVPPSPTTNTRVAGTPVDNKSPSFLSRLIGKQLD